MQFQNSFRSRGKPGAPLAGGQGEPGLGGGKAPAVPGANISLGQNPNLNSFPSNDTKRSFSGEVKKVSSGSVSSYRYPQDQKTDIHTEENLKKNLNSFQKRYYTSYSKLSEVKIISIGMASPLRILQWAEKTLPNGRIYGEVLNANTLHHKTFKPQKGGLFCERIFGPLKDFECACGKIDKSVKPSGLGVKGLGDNLTHPWRSQGLGDPPGLPGGPKKGQNPFLKNTRKFCPDCDVEYTWSVIRRYQLGYIKLNSPVLHVWFMKGTPSYLSILLDMKKRHLQNVAYCSETLTLENSLSQDYAQKSLSFDSPSKIFSSWQSLIKNGKNGKFSMETRKDTLGYLPLDQTTQENPPPLLKAMPRGTGGKTLSPFGKETLNEYRGLKRKKIQPVRQTPLAPPGQGLGPSFNEWLRQGLGIPFKNGEARGAQGWDKLNRNTIGLEGNGTESNGKVFPILERKFSSEGTPWPPTGLWPVGIPSRIPVKGYAQGDGEEFIDSPLPASQGGLVWSRKNYSMFKFLNALQYSIYHDSRALKNTESFKMYTSKSEESSLGGREYGLNSDSYKVSPMVPAANTLKNSLMIWNKILKNLPMDLYILCSMERMYHKKILFLSIFHKWQKLYKQAYYKAMYKATKILKTSLAGPSPQRGDWSTSSGALPQRIGPTPEGLSEGTLGAQEFNSFGHPWPIPLASQDLGPNPGTVGGETPHLTRKGMGTNPTLYTYNTSALFLNRFIQTTKAYFKNYVLLKLKTIVQPIDSFYLTTHLNCNSSQIIHQLSEEMEKNWDLAFTSTLSKEAKPSGQRGEYSLGRHTENGQGSDKTERQMFLHQNAFLNKLSFYFLKPLLIVFYLEQKRKNYVLMTSPVNGERLNKFTNGDYSLEGLEERITDMTSVTMSGAKPQTVLYKTLVLYIQKIKNINSLEVSSPPPRPGDGQPAASFVNSPQSLSDFSGQRPEERTREFEKGFSQSPIPGPGLGQGLGIPLASQDLGPRELYPAGGTSPETGNVFIKHIPLEKKVLGDAHRLVSDSLKGNQIYDKNKNQQPALSNTIYTLSHRERWNAEKDWLYFLLYNTVSSEYTDLPIYAYKSRLFSTNPLAFGQGVYPSSWPEARKEDCFSRGGSGGGSGEKTSFSFLNFGKSAMENTGLNPAMGGQSTQGFVSSKMESVLSNAFFSGPGIVQQLLKEFSFSEIKKLDKQNRLLLYQLNIYLFKIKKQVEIFFYDKTYQKEFKELCKKRDLLIRRTKFVRKFFRKDSDPSSMILTVLPVLPPDLRPIVKMGNQIAASDLNRLYQRVIYRNERLKKFLKDPATSHSYEMKYAQRLLQEAVDNLIINGKSPNSEKDSRNRPLKSLSDILKGKQGRFRQFLLGKRVDYSGRSVIVVGPKLKLHECGIPLEMALELYLPFLLKIILNKNYAKTVIGAKSLIKKNPALAQELLREIMQVSPVLLNRAPTLHRLGFQAFVPKLVTGRAILLHPLVCSAFNADFDGDQMAVHVPITVEARAEAWKLMLARNNILSPATGEPLAIPSQDMVLGCYYLTTLPNKIQFPQLPVQHFNLTPPDSRRGEGFVPQKDNLAFQNNSPKVTAAENESMLLTHGVSDSAGRGSHNNTIIPEQSPAGMIPPASGQGANVTLLYFKNVDDVMNAYNQQKILVHSYVWVKWTGFIENGNDQEEPIEIRIAPHGQWQEISANYHRFYENNNILINIYMVTTPGRILFNYILQNRTP